MIKLNYFEADLMEYRDYFEADKKERQKFEDWLMDCNEKLSYLGPKVREYEDTRKRIEKGE